MSSTLEQARTFFLEGVAHFEAGRLEAAEARFATALALAPGRPSVLTNLGVVRVRLGRFAEALPLLDDALEQEPDNREALAHRAMARAEVGRLAPALRDLDHLLTVAPDYGRGWGLRGRLLKDLGRRDEAIAALERAIELGSEVDLNRYTLAGLRGEAAPPAPPPGYVEALFDAYAGEFDGHLVEVLQYRAPERLLQPLQTRGQRFDRALDLGCGTGLCAPWLRKLAGHVTGVDLSSRMLERARASGGYDELAQADLVEFLSRATQPWELVVAADVFIYVGDLEPAFTALQPAMAAGGLLCLSLEESEDESLALRPSLRYAHSEASLRSIAVRHGFEVRELQRAPVRHDQGQPIAGLYAWLERT